MIDLHNFFSLGIGITINVAKSSRSAFLKTKDAALSQRDPSSVENL